MNAEIQIRKLPDGRVQARRRDGKPMTVEDRQEAKRLAGAVADKAVDEGGIIAVLIDAAIVGPVWFAFNDNFHSGDNIPVFFASEIPFLQKMTEAELRRRYDEKRIFAGGWIRNGIDERTKH